MQTNSHTVISNIKIDRDSSFIQTQKRLNRFQYSAAGIVSKGKHPKCSKTTYKIQPSFAEANSFSKGRGSHSQSGLKKKTCSP